MSYSRKPLPRRGPATNLRPAGAHGRARRGDVDWEDYLEGEDDSDDELDELIEAAIDAEWVRVFGDREPSLEEATDFYMDIIKRDSAYYV